MKWREYLFKAILTAVVTSGIVFALLEVMNFDQRLDELTVKLNKHVDDIDNQTKRLEKTLDDVENNFEYIIRQLAQGTIDLEEYNRLIDEERRTRP